ncbi:hypothetical protein P3T22_000929 [Paraburkholderia sp. GAS348]
MGVYHWGELCRERGMAVRAGQYGVGNFTGQTPAGACVRLCLLLPLRKNADMFGVRINGAGGNDGVCRTPRNCEAENGKQKGQRQKTKKACRLGKPLILFRRFEPLQLFKSYLVAGVGFEPTTFGL